MNSTADIVPVVLCGGEGVRLWPVSRRERPKPFMVMADGRSLVAGAFDRAARLGSGGMLVVTSQDLRFQVADEHRASTAAQAPLTMLLEPIARNTAAAVAVAAEHLAATEGADTVMAIVPADHMIEDEQGLARRIAEARAPAEAGSIVVFGITPNAPSTEFGYVEMGAHGEVSFTEKPDAKTAQAFVADGRHLWNSGMFVMTAATAIAAFKAHAPKVLAAAGAALEGAARTRRDGVEEIALDAEAYGRIEPISFDHAVMERADNIVCVECDVGWSDLGTWSALSALSEPDADGNRVAGEAILIDARDCDVRSEGRVVGVVGLDHVIVVDTDDALLVADAAQTGKVRDLHAKLRERGHAVADAHRTTHRPWGTYTVLNEGPGFKIKRIVVTPGGRLSLQSHRHRSEHWVVVAGRARITHQEGVREIGVNQSAYIEKGARHRLENRGKEPLVLIEVQCGEYLGEDDIERYDDVYGRREAQ